MSRISAVDCQFLDFLNDICRTGELTLGCSCPRAIAAVTTVPSKAHVQAVAGESHSRRAAVPSEAPIVAMIVPTERNHEIAR